MILRDFLCGLATSEKAIQKCDFILSFRQELRKSVHAFVQNSVSMRSSNSEKLR